MMKKLLALFCTLTVGLCCCATVRLGALPEQSPLPAPPAVSAEAAVLMDATSGAVYFEKSAEKRMGPASTTKLMTALVAAEQTAPEQIVTIPPEAVGIEGSSVYLIAGEHLTMQDLLYALLLSSANDAATAIAIAVAGSTEEFVWQMNKRANELGLCDTQFQNPHGLYDEEHYTTAKDLATIARAVLDQPLLRRIVSTYKTTIPHNGTPDTRLLVNHNKLLRTYQGAIGMKTGFTKKTGRTLVSAAERDGLTLIAVTLNAPNDWRDHTAILDYGFSCYETVTLAEAGSFFYHLPVSGGEKEQVTLTNTEPLRLTLRKDHREIAYCINTQVRFELAPVRMGKELGTVTISCDGQECSSPLISTYSVNSKHPVKKSFFERIMTFFRTDENKG